MIRRLSVALTILTLTLTIFTGSGIANAAGSVTVTYRAFPTGEPVLVDLGAISGCVKNIKAPQFIAEPVTPATTPPTFTNYEFIFWNIKGVQQTDRTVSFCSSSTDTFATAWYIAQGGGNCPASGCYASTWAFSLDQNKVLPDVTPIASVTPNTPTAWTAPSTTVLTNSNETIAARADIDLTAPAETEAFQYWWPLLGTKVSGIDFAAKSGTSPDVIAFYNKKAGGPPPNPCLGKPLPCRPQ